LGGPEREISNRRKCQNFPQNHKRTRKERGAIGLGELSNIDKACRGNPGKKGAAALSALGDDLEGRHSRENQLYRGVQCPLVKGDASAPHLNFDTLNSVMGKKGGGGPPQKKTKHTIAGAQNPRNSQVTFT